MAQPALTAYSVGAGQQIHGGRWPGGLLSGAVALGDVSPAGSMASNASAITGGVTLDDVVPGGTLSDGTPAWLAGAVVNQWATIAGTTCPNALNEYSGAAWREEADLIEALSLASGGHGGNLTNNAVYGLRLDVDAPAWQTLRSASDATGWSTTGSGGAYFPSDGRPVPRHTYWNNHWVPELQRYMMFGAKFVGSGANDYLTRDGFRRDTNDWDASGTYTNIPAGGYMSLRRPSTGVFYATQGSLQSFNPSTGTFGNAGWTGSGTVNRGGSAWDTTRDVGYHLSSGDNYSAPSSTIASTRFTAAGVCTPITFNSSAGWTDFQASAASFSNGSQLTYDPDLDRFYFYPNLSANRAKVYRITPNGGTTWDMDILPVTGVTPASAGEPYTKFRYLPKFKALVLLPGGALVHFLRTQ